MAKSPARARRYAPRMPPEERREQLLDATLVLVTQDGYETVSMEGIARRAGVTKPVLYDLFGSLPDLLEALLAREEERALSMLDELMPPATEDPDPGETIRLGLDAFLRAVEAHPGAWQLILMPDEAIPAVARERLEPGGGRVTGRLKSIARTSVRGMAADRSDDELLVETLVLFTKAAGRWHLADPKRYSRERLTEFTAGLVGSMRA